MTIKGTEGSQSIEKCCLKRSHFLSSPRALGMVWKLENEQMWWRVADSALQDNVTCFPHCIQWSGPEVLFSTMFFLMWIYNKSCQMEAPKSYSDHTCVFLVHIVFLSNCCQYLTSFMDSAAPFRRKFKIWQYCAQASLRKRLSKCGAWTSSISITWGPVRNADAQAPSQTCWGWGPTMCVLTGSLGDCDTWCSKVTVVLVNLKFLAEQFQWGRGKYSTEHHSQGRQNILHSFINYTGNIK